MKAKQYTCLLLIVALLMSCHTTHHATQSDEVAIGCHEDLHLEQSQFWRLHVAADSASWWWRADSVVTPNGTTIYAPEVGATIVAPAIDVAASDSAAIDTASSSVLSSHKETDTQSEITAIAQPPDLWWLLVLVVLAIAVYFWRLYSKK